MLLSVEPLNRIIVSEDSLKGLVTARCLLLIRADAVKLGRLAATRSKGSEVNVGGSRVRQVGDMELAKQVDAIGGDCDTDQLEVFGAECGELGVAEVFLRRISDWSANTIRGWLRSLRQP